jgi:hypothetical protein
MLRTTADAPGASGKTLTHISVETTFKHRG